ncbi:hypothetical protein ATANTOWER_021704 [Ataeniobius toweri]|uniref:Uncharacterized protein n=1 Tax=Ataeniobius toweri TaxID=208326 RepID=A0ABU7CKC9_9TELE|nr:hypothetical protein [Ataeniobius toweri]
MSDLRSPSRTSSKLPSLDHLDAIVHPGAMSSSGNRRTEGQYPSDKDTFFLRFKTLLLNPHSVPQGRSRSLLVLFFCSYDPVALIPTVQNHTMGCTIALCCCSVLPQDGVKFPQTENPLLTYVLLKRDLSLQKNRTDVEWTQLDYFLYLCSRTWPVSG